MKFSCVLCSCGASHSVQSTRKRWLYAGRRHLGFADGDSFLVMNRIPFHHECCCTSKFTGLIEYGSVSIVNIKYLIMNKLSVEYIVLLCN